MNKALCACALSLIVTGCASVGNLNTAFRIEDLEVNEVAFIDAHQRAIITGERIIDGETRRIVCAEPGPDVFAARSGAMSANASNNQASAGFAGSTAESAGQLSTPTTAILSQRHAYYRLCEEFLNGDADDIEYMIGIRNNQRDLATLLAIEQLTGAVRAAPVVLSSGGTANSGQVLAQLTAYRAAAENRREEYSRQVTALTGRHAAAVARIAAIDERLAQSGVTQEEATRLTAEKSQKGAERDRLEAEKNQASAAVVRAEEDIRRLEEAIRGAREGSAATTAQGVAIGETTIAPEAAEHISNAIVRLVQMSNSRDFGPTTCFAMMRRGNAPADITAQCNAILTAYAGSLASASQTQTAMAYLATTIISAAREQHRALTSAEAELVSQILEMSGPVTSAAVMPAGRQ